MDAHHHVWGPSQTCLPWVAAHPVLQRSWTVQDLEPHLAASGVTQTVLVQAANVVTDTAHLLSAACDHPSIAGVVGWLPLDDPRQVEGMLERWRDLPLVGVRHLPDEADDDKWLARPEHAAALELLAARGLALDVAARTPGHLAALCTVADTHPDLVVVLDHLGKPPLGSPEQLADWRRNLTEVARRPRTVAKLSGLSTCAAPDWTPDDLRPAVEHALEHFSAARCCWGSDWPVSLLRGKYEDELAAVQHLLAGASDAERDAVLSGTARRAYALSAPTSVVAGSEG